MSILDEKTGSGEGDRVGERGVAMATVLEDVEPDATGVGERGRVIGRNLDLRGGGGPMLGLRE